MYVDTSPPKDSRYQPDSSAAAAGVTQLMFSTATSASAPSAPAGHQSMRYASGAGAPDVDAGAHVTDSDDCVTRPASDADGVSRVGGGGGGAASTNRGYMPPPVFCATSVVVPAPASLTSAPHAT